MTYVFGGTLSHTQSINLENPEIYLWFNLTNMPFIYRMPCVSKCMKYHIPAMLLTEQFLCNL